MCSIELDFGYSLVNLQVILADGGLWVDCILQYSGSTRTRHLVHIL